MSRYSSSKKRKSLTRRPTRRSSMRQQSFNMPQQSLPRSSSMSSKGSFNFNDPRKMSSSFSSLSPSSSIPFVPSDPGVRTAINVLSFILVVLFIAMWTCFGLAMEIYSRPEEMLSLVNFIVFSYYLWIVAILGLIMGFMGVICGVLVASTGDEKLNMMFVIPVVCVLSSVGFFIWLFATNSFVVLNPRDDSTILPTILPNVVIENTLPPVE